MMDTALKYNEIKSSIGLCETDFWTEIPAQVKQAIDKAKAELDGGEGTPHKQVMSEIKDRFLGR